MTKVQLNTVILQEVFMYHNVTGVKYRRYGLPSGFLLGGGKWRLKYKISHNILEIWQP